MRTYPWSVYILYGPGPTDNSEPVGVITSIRPPDSTQYRCRPLSSIRRRAPVEEALREKRPNGIIKAPRITLSRVGHSRAAGVERMLEAGINLCLLMPQSRFRQLPNDYVDIRGVGQEMSGGELADSVAPEHLWHRAAGRRAHQHQTT